MLINCDHCGISFSKSPSKVKSKNYCSKKCRHSDKYTLLNCGTCGKEFEKINTTIFPNNFCSRKCAAIFTSPRMTDLNKKMNPERMTFENRLRIREGRLRTSPGCKSYKKYLGVHVHRIVAADKLGRKLKKGEIVHHKDENIHNNHPDNLEVLASQSDHARHHMLKRYGKTTH